VRSIPLRVLKATEGLMPRVELYSFEYQDERGKWMRARYRASRETIGARYKAFRLLGDPEVREESDDPLASLQPT
jgi:hypothetical protein